MRTCSDLASILHTTVAGWVCKLGRLILCMDVVRSIMAPWAAKVRLERRETGLMKPCHECSWVGGWVKTVFAIKTREERENCFLHTANCPACPPKNWQYYCGVYKNKKKIERGFLRVRKNKLVLVPRSLSEEKEPHKFVSVVTFCERRTKDFFFTLVIDTHWK